MRKREICEDGERLRIEKLEEEEEEIVEMGRRSRKE